MGLRKGGGLLGDNDLASFRDKSLRTRVCGEIMIEI